MAKYRLTVVHSIEDNEEMQSASEMNKYVEEVVETGIGDWDKIEATLVANDTSVFHSETSKNNESQKKHGWPWHRSTDCLPTDDDEHIIACEYINGVWTAYEFYTLRDNPPRFVGYDSDSPTILYPSPNVYWRTVAEPEPPNPEGV